MTDTESLRAEIERIDRELIRLIGERVQVASEMGKAKRIAGLLMLDPAQEAVVIRRAATLARAAQLPEEEIRDIFWQLVALSRRVRVDSEGDVGGR
jgi:chorismate mutase